MAGRKAPSLGDRFSDVLDRARRGDASAQAELYGCYRGTVVAIVRRRLPGALRPKYDSLDLAHSVFAEVLRELPRLDDRGERAFVGLLALKAQCKVRLKLRRHLGRDGGRTERRIATDAVPPAPGSPVGIDVDDVEDSLKLRGLLDGLAAADREILRLHGEGRPFAEIASAVGLPSADAARKRHARLVLALRRRWNQSGKGTSPWSPRPTSS